MTPAKRISADIWERIEQSWIHKVRLGEETLTDLLILDLARYAPEGVRLFQTPKAQEAQCGTDLEIIISTGGRFIALAIQAKKLYRSGRYDHLNARVGGTNFPQIDILERYSRRVRAIPLYLLYNFVDETWERPYRIWALRHVHYYCSTIGHIQQLGCTFAPSWRIRQAIENRGCRTFEWIHNHIGVFPWHCLFDCPYTRWNKLLSLDKDNLERQRHQNGQDQNQREYEWLELEPSENTSFDWLWKHDATILTEEDIEEFYRYRNIKRSDLIYRVPSEGGGRADSQKTVDLIPRHYLLIKPEQFKIERENLEHPRYEY